MQTDCRITSTELTLNNGKEFFSFVVKGNKDELNDLYFNLCEKRDQIALTSTLDQKLNISLPKDINTTTKTAEMLIKTELRMDFLKAIEYAAENSMIKKLNVNYMLAYVKEARLERQEMMKANDPESRNKDV